eukprot:TRINITY_DN111373_c0_g1_i1.p1 TRINITY_DN111373_c0_g1~~TRINITY_DN111373_c0_g1_i1.p1  ORF type:complete len:307 (+),score=41.13 TRINITY_DN111373_c0_g1_i1:132-923(+)
MAFGRDELPKFHAAIGPEAVFITTAGAIPRIGFDTVVFGSGSGGAVATSLTPEPASTPWKEGCACISGCRLNYPLGPLDIVVPFNIGHNSSSGRTGPMGFLGARRPILGFYAGANTSCSRSRLVNRWSRKSIFEKDNILVSGKSFDEVSFHRTARRSVFCLVPDGHWPATQRLPAVVARGCIPVLISQRVELPWSDLIDWSKASLWLYENQIKDLAHQLRNVPGEKVLDMQELLPLLSEALDYHSTRFHLLLLASLAARRQPT